MRIAKKRFALGEIHQAQSINNDSNENNNTSKKNNKRFISKFENIKILYTNADQLPNKKDDLLQLIAGNEPDVIMMTEVIPKQQKHLIPSSLLHINDYTQYLSFDVESENLGTSGINIRRHQVRHALL